VLPLDGPLGLSHGALRWWAVALLAACSAATVAIAFASPTRLQRQSRLPRWVPVVVTALLVRALCSLVQDGGTFDVLVAYRAIGEHLFAGRDIWTGTTDSLATYPPTVYLWWAVAGLIPAGHPHLFAAAVRAPFWIADAAVAVLLLRIIPGASGARAAWLYALCPVVIAVPTLHGQVDPVVDLLLVAGVALLQRGQATAGGIAVGAAIVVKQWPVYFLLPLLAAVTRRRAPVLLLCALAPLLASFGIYALFHAADAWRGLSFVATYRPHRQGLGTSVLFPDDSPAGIIIATNIAAVLAGAVAGVAALRSQRSLAEAMALDMLIVVGLSPTVSDQYLMWAIPFLLLAGRLRTAALLGVGLLPAVLSLDLWTSVDGTATPRALLLLATASVLAAAGWLLSPRAGGSGRGERRVAAHAVDGVVEAA